MLTAKFIKGGTEVAIWDTMSLTLSPGDRTFPDYRSFCDEFGNKNCPGRAILHVDGVWFSGYRDMLHQILLTNIRLRGARFRVDTRRRLHAWSFRRQQDVNNLRLKAEALET